LRDAEAANEGRRVLVIAYFFPPSNASGTHRTMRYARYLPEFGWQPIVLTVKDEVHWIVDEGLLAQLPPGLQVHRTRSIEPARALGRLAGSFGRALRGGRHPAEGPAPVGDSDPQPSTGAVMATLKKGLGSVQDLLSIPDAQIGWLPFATWTGMRVIRSTRPELIYTTAQPWTASLIGLALKRLTGLPWIADVRDGWTVASGFHGTTSGLKRVVSRALERLVIRTADLIIVTTNATRDAYLRHFEGELTENRVAVIYNGFDSRHLDAMNYTSASGDSRFTLVMAGTTRAAHDLLPFCEALSDVVRGRELSPEQIRVSFVGDVYPALVQHVKSLAITEYVCFTERVSYEESKSVIGQSTALLLPIGCVAGSEFTVPAKAFHYLLADKPILALAPESSEVANLVRESGSGIVVSPTDRRAIGDAVLRLYDEHEKGGLDKYSVTQNFLDRFRADRLTGQLSEHMKNLSLAGRP